MSAADAARDAMQRAAKEAYKPIHDAGTAYVKAHQAITAATDIDTAAPAMVDLIVAAEKLEADAKAAAEATRNALAAFFDETGAPEVLTMHHRAAMAHKPAFVSIDQPELLPENYWNKPTPDRSAIKKALEGGDMVPGCQLLKPNAMSLRITARK